MELPVDRRTAFGGLAGAALAYGLTAESGGQGPAASGGAAPPRPGDPVMAKLGERPSVRDKGAKGDGVAMDGAAIQDALRAYDTVWVPPGVYMIDVPLLLPSYCVLAFSSQAIFCPAHDGMTVFRTGEVSYASRVLAPRVHARGKRSVTAFDLKGFRHRAEIQHADIHECARGIILRELCWDTIIYMPWIRQTAQPILVSNGSNAVDVIHPGLDGFDIGITVEPGAKNATTTARVWGGYIQNGRCGIVDRGAIGTVVEGTYFEGLRDADISLMGSIRPSLSRTQHYGNTGAVAIQGIGVDGLTVFDPLMSSGTRTVGLYDFDAASRNVTRFESDTAAGTNRPIGNVGRSQTLAREEGGAFRPTLASGSDATVYGDREGRWRRSGNQLSVAVELSWSGRGGGAIVISGLSAVTRLPSAPIAALAPATVRGSGAGQAHARLDGEGNLHLVTMEGGVDKPILAGASGAVSVSLTCLL